MGLGGLPLWPLVLRLRDRLGLGAGDRLGPSMGGVIAPGFYTFVGERDILAPRVSTVIVSTRRNVTIVNTTTNITNYTVVNGRIVNSGVSADRIAQVTGRPVPRVAVASMARASANGKGAFYQPPVVTRAARAAPAEFGKALPTQVATQQKSRVFVSAAAASRSGTAASRSRTTTNATGSGTSSTTAGQRSKRTTGTAAGESSHGSGHYGVGVDNTSHGKQGSGAGSTGSAGSTGTTGTAAGHGQPGSPPSGQAKPQGGPPQGAGAAPQHQPQPPPKKKAPPPEKEKEKTGI